MRTESDAPGAALPDRLRASWGEARRWLARQGRATRVALILAGLGIAGAAGYLVTGEHVAGPDAVALYEGRRLSSDDRAAIAGALDAEAIPYSAPDFPAGQVFVKADRKKAALEAIGKHRAAPVSLAELSRDEEPESPWTTPADRERREHARLEQSLKRQVENLGPPITAASVRISRDKVYSSLSSRWNVHAYVYLMVEGGRHLPNRTIEGIETFLIGAVPDLKPDAITVTDQTGWKYMAAGDAPLKIEVRKHVQEEEWSDRIAEKLRHVPGVAVFVTLESVSVTPPVPVVPAAPMTDFATPNQPLQIGPPTRPVVAAPAPVTRTKANVLIHVPRSFYLMAAQAQSGNRHPSAEELGQMQETTARIAREAVDISIPRDLRGDCRVVTVQDDLATSRTVLVPADPAEPTPLRWLIGGIGGSLVVLLLLGGAAVRMATRRPAQRPSVAWRPGFVADEPNPGPTERVRELIRLDPEAAAGVLQRWIGQKGVVG